MKIRMLVVFAVIAGAIYSCKTSPDLDKLSTAFVVSTNRASTVNFSDYNTYYIPDTIAFISNDKDDDDTLIVGAPAKAVVDEVKKNMTARGYTFVNRSQNPDLGLKALAIKQVNTGVIYPPGWWWGYPGYPGGCYWGCYPPYYPIYPTVYQYTTGDFILETFDVKNAEENNNLQAIWLVQLSGVLGSTSATNIQMTIDGINQAFIQSPYIKK